MKRSIRIIFFILLSLWCAGFSNSIYLDKGNNAVVNMVLMPFYSPVCHQAPEKTISFSGGRFLVCSRCTGIYAGILAFSFISLFTTRVKGKYILPASLLMLADVFFTSTGVYNYSLPLAFLTGFLFGLALFPYILSIIENSFSGLPDESK